MAKWTLKDDQKLLGDIYDYIHRTEEYSEKEGRVRDIVENTLSELSTEQKAQYLGELIIQYFADGEQ